MQVFCNYGLSAAMGVYSALALTLDACIRKGSRGLCCWQSILERFRIVFATEGYRDTPALAQHSDVTDAL